MKKPKKYLTWSKISKNFLNININFHKNKVKARRILASLLIANMTALSLFAPIQSEAIGGPSDKDAPKGMNKVCENDYLTLYLNEEDVTFAVKDNETGHLWFSNPQDTENDQIASPYYQRIMKNQVQIRYFNEDVQVSTMDSYNDCVSHGQFEIEMLEDGYKVSYTLGEMAQELLLPMAISEERFEQFVGLMDDKSAKKVRRNYVLEESDEGNFYRLRDGVKDYIKEDLAEYFQEAGYTQSDYEIDSELETAEDTNNKPWFTIGVEYRLDNDSLTVSVDPMEVTYNEDGYYLVSIDLLPYFGAAGTEDTGYMFVPDGCGALIDLNNGKSDVSGYSSRIYGQDLSQQLLSTKKSETDDTYGVKLPVYGLKTEDQAFLAIIENGDGYGTINAGVSGKTTSYNNIYCSFDYLAYGEASLTNVVGANSYQLYGNKEFSDTYKVRFKFLSDDKADYSHMASLYRDYLIAGGRLKETADEADEIPLYTELIGAIDKYKTFLGVRYRAIEALTTYEEAKIITDELMQGGISDQTLIYSGWMNDGLKGYANYDVNPVGKLNKGLSLKSFLQEEKELGVNTYMTLDIQNVYQNKLTDGYSTLSNAPGYFDHTVVYSKEYSLSGSSSTGKEADLISPYFALDYTKKLINGLSKYEITGVDFTYATYRLYSDYLEERYTDREAAIALYESSFNEAVEGGMGMMGDNANAYALPYLNQMINVPLYSNRYRIIDREIPFYQMVIHGSLSYSGEALNMADDYETSLLKSVECGAGLHYLWIYKDNSLLKETDYDDLYSVQYSSWKDKAISDYARVNEALKGLTGVSIVSHEYISEDLVKVTYDNGTKIYVNYSDEAVTADGVTVEARSFSRLD